MGQPVVHDDHQVGAPQRNVPARLFDRFRVKLSRHLHSNVRLRLASDLPFPSMRGQRTWGWAAALVVAVTGCGAGRRGYLGDEVPRPQDANLGPSDDGGISSNAGVVRSAPDAAAEADSGVRTTCPDGGQPSPLVRTTPVAAIPPDTMRLLGDSAGVFGVTSSGMIWALDASATALRQLVPPGAMGRSIAITLAGQNLFWTDVHGGTLHRTARDGSGDAVLATGLAGPDLVTTDDSRVYWFEESSQPAYGGGTIRSLPSDAPPGDSPSALVTISELAAVSSIAAAGGSLYWTPYTLGATVYYSGLATAPVAALLAGQPPVAVPEIDPTYEQPYGLVVAGSTVYFGYYRNLWTTAVARIPQQSGTPVLVSILPIDVGISGLLVKDGWLLISGGAGNRALQLYAAPTDGAGFVVVATDLAVPAAISPWGIAYVDHSGALVAFPTAQLGYVGYGAPAP